MSSADYKTHLKVLNQFLDKSDARDKLLAALQYAAMFAAAGAAGDAKRVQASVAAARKVFRIMKPLEVLNPLISNPSINKNKPFAIEILNKLKPVLMAIYFGADHLVWASQAGISSNKELTRRAQKASFYGWLGGSLCTLAAELYELAAILGQRRGESVEAYRARVDAARGEVNRRLMVLVHAAFQAALAVGLLELRPWRPRTVGFLGIVASVLNCYMLYPPRPAPAKLAVKTS